jgi:hypothetical protein
VAVKMVSGKDHECPVLYELVKQFVEMVGKGVIKISLDANPISLYSIPDVLSSCNSQSNGER